MFIKCVGGIRDDVFCLGNHLGVMFNAHQYDSICDAISVNLLNCMGFKT